LENNNLMYSETAVGRFELKSDWNIDTGSGLASFVKYTKEGRIFYQECSIFFKAGSTEKGLAYFEKWEANSKEELEKVLENIKVFLDENGFEYEITKN